VHMASLSRLGRGRAAVAVSAYIMIHPVLYSAYNFLICPQLGFSVKSLDGIQVQIVPFLNVRSASSILYDRIVP